MTSLVVVLKSQLFRIKKNLNLRKSSQTATSGVIVLSAIESVRTRKVLFTKLSELIRQPFVRIQIVSRWLMTFIEHSNIKIIGVAIEYIQGMIVRAYNGTVHQLIVITKNAGHFCQISVVGGLLHTSRRP